MPSPSPNKWTYERRGQGHTLCPEPGPNCRVTGAGNRVPVHPNKPTSAAREGDLRLRANKRHRKQFEFHAAIFSSFLTASRNDWI